MKHAPARPIVRVFVKDGAVFANSRDIAEAFGKRNADVNRAVRDLLADLPPEAQRNFAPKEINDLTGTSVADYDMTRDGFTLLVMGFAGSMALSWKLRYIEAFNRMEQELLRQALASSSREPSDASPRSLYAPRPVANVLR